MGNTKLLHDHCLAYMNKLCVEISERSVGSEGNKESTRYFEKNLSALGWMTNEQNFSAIDWHDGGAHLQIGGLEFEAFVSPYSLGFSGTGQLVSASNLSELQKGDFHDKILLLHGDITKEQLMPKNFVFYNPEEHKQIITNLEKSGAKAIVCATGRDPALAGGVYPFPLIEDGDFDIPSVYLTEEEGKYLLSHVDDLISLKSVSKRIPSNGSNVIGKKGKDGLERIVITAHIDSKKGTPGATDNGTGISILLLLAELLKNYSGNKQIEIVALNGEDYYSVPGQMKYIEENQGKFQNILLNINIDGAAYIEGKTTFSFFDLKEDTLNKVTRTIGNYPDMKEGIQWPQGDHSIFLYQGRSAIAVSSEWFTENSESQDITHTTKDNLEIVDFNKIVEIAIVLNELIREL